MTKTIRTLSDLTNALVLNGYQRVEGDSYLTPPDGLKDKEIRWSYRPYKRSLMIARGFEVVQGAVIPDFILCELDQSSEHLASLTILDSHLVEIACLQWMRVSLDLILQLANGITRAWVMSEVADDQWIESCEKNNKEKTND